MNFKYCLNVSCIAILSVSLLFLMPLGATYATSTNTYTYIGSDTTTSDRNSFLKSIGNSSYISYPVTKEYSILNLFSNTSNDDNVSIYINNTPYLYIKYTNNSPTFNAIGLSDILLTAGIYNASIYVDNNTNLGTISEIISGYSKLTQTNIGKTQLNDALQEYSLMNQVQSFTKNPESAQILFLNINKYLMDDPDLGFATNSIVDLSFSKSKINENSMPQIRDQIYSFVYKLTEDGNRSPGFFKDSIMAYDTNGSVKFNFDTLNSVSNQYYINPETEK